MKYLLFAIDMLRTFGLILLSIFTNVLKCSIPKRFFKKSVNNKVVLITGAGNGVGAALAVRFAKQRSRLVLWDINIDDLKRTINECKEYQSDLFIIGMKVDISDKFQINNAADMVKAEVGNVDILINNAGVVTPKSILELEESSIRKTFNVNVISHIWIVQAFLPEMLARNSGHIVAISSYTGLIGCRKLADYCSSKFAIVGFQEALLSEIRSSKNHGLQLLTVYPFHIKTSMFDQYEFNCPILPSLELNYVAFKIEEAILTNASVLYLPRLVYFLVVLKHLLPYKAFIHLLNLLINVSTTKKQ